METDGALYETFSRGKKDNFFISDNPESTYIFDNRYKPQVASIHELRRTIPLTAPNWGRPVEFEIEMAGDLSREHTLLITLPSWIPTNIQTPPGIIVDSTGSAAPTWIPNIAYMLFEKIQFFQDSLLLQEISGDSLYFKSLLDSSLNQGVLNTVLTNPHQGALRLPLPIPGFQDGLPSLTAQTYRLKVWIRKLDRLLPPIPPTLYYKAAAHQTPEPFQTQAIKAPLLFLETKHYYLNEKDQKEYRSKPFYIPYKQLYENIFTFSSLEYSSGGIVTRRLEACHPSARIFFYFRNKKDLNNMIYSNIVNSSPTSTSFWSSLSLLVAGQDRESSWSPQVWRNIVQHAKVDRTLSKIQEIGIIDWTLGDVHERRLPFDPVPEGTLNFTTADRPTFLINLVDTPGSQSEMRVVVESWAVLIIENGRARMMSVN
jgi:hypothetical protein